MKERIECHMRKSLEEQHEVLSPLVCVCVCMRLCWWCVSRLICQYGCVCVCVLCVKLLRITFGQEPWDAHICLNNINTICCLFMKSIRKLCGHDMASHVVACWMYIVVGVVVGIANVNLLHMFLFSFFLSCEYRMKLPIIDNKYMCVCVYTRLLVVLVCVCVCVYIFILLVILSNVFSISIGGADYAPNQTTSGPTYHKHSIQYRVVCKIAHYLKRAPDDGNFVGVCVRVSVSVWWCAFVLKESSMPIQVYLRCRFGISEMWFAEFFLCYGFCFFFFLVCFVW